MAHKVFRQDLAQAAASPPVNIGSISRSGDGEVDFSYNFFRNGVAQTINLGIYAHNLDEYPAGTKYILATTDPVDENIDDEIARLSSTINGKTVLAALHLIATGLDRCLTAGCVDNPINIDDSDGSPESATSPDNEDYYDSGSLGGDEDDLLERGSNAESLHNTKKSNTSPQKSIDMKKCRSDLRAAKQSGFKIGIIGDPTESGVVCVSIRISKLGISDEVLKAWHLENTQYLVLLIRFMEGYRTLDQVKDEKRLDGKTQMRVGMCKSYKPSTQSVFHVFNPTTTEESSDTPAEEHSAKHNFQQLFISESLDYLLLTRFPGIIRFRSEFKLLWRGAEQLVNDVERGSPLDGHHSKYSVDENDTFKSLPLIVIQDSLQGQSLPDCSLPLVSMQFVLRHFVRCTDFCLACHCPVEYKFKALKPYVCSDPLCLYQYMSLGFGPSIEWEIMSQPHVVDLLISFCYLQAQAHRLRVFPVGIGLKVAVPLVQPVITTSFGAQTSNTAQSKKVPFPQPASQERLSVTAQYNYQARLLTLPDEQKNMNLLKPKDLVVLQSKSFAGLVHHKVVDIVFPIITLSQPVRVKLPELGEMADSRMMPIQICNVECYKYDQDFDTLADDEKQQAIMSLLDIIPSTKEMLAHLRSQGSGRVVSLQEWSDRINKPAFDVLRWIIASNRSCIMQVDTITDDASKVVISSLEDRVSGMDNYMQFRFAQGAPDKEQRFADSIKDHGSSHQYPTLFAWHGSPLSSWHSIIREGLHFKDVVHGRAYGNGVYLSSQLSVSLGYSQPIKRTSWPNSELNISAAVSLCEVVNNKPAFVSSHPYYVVAETDWIQTRYLFVQTSVQHTRSSNSNSSTTEFVQQDPTCLVYGLGRNGQREVVSIPLTAIPTSRQSHSQSHVPPPTRSRNKRTIHASLQNSPRYELEDDAASMVTLDEDLVFWSDSTDNKTDSDFEMNRYLRIDSDELESPRKKARTEVYVSKETIVSGCLLDETKTDFRPGELKLDQIKMLAPPEDSLPSANGALMKAFKAILTTQKTTPAHEIGWYINPEHTDNMYQWILELHSFDAEIPLSKDMKSANIRSVVIEVRFTNQFPFAPPFVRVVQPRFLPFSQGGGGHVTEGGAICMELLTNSGWSAASSMESVLLQVRLAMSETERPARLLGRGQLGARYGGKGGSYGIGEAILAFERACRMHGWTVPNSLASMQRE